MPLGVTECMDVLTENLVKLLETEDFTQTSEKYPTEWRATDEGGKFIQIHYANGYLYVAIDGGLVFNKQITSNGYSSQISWDSVLEAVKRGE